MIVWADKNQTGIVREMGHQPGECYGLISTVGASKVRYCDPLRHSHFLFASGIVVVALAFTLNLLWEIHDNNSIVPGPHSSGGERSDARGGKSVAFSRQNGGAGGGWGLNSQPARYLWMLEQELAWLRASHTSLQTFINSRENVAPILQLTTFSNARSQHLALPFIQLFPFIASAFSAHGQSPLNSQFALNLNLLRFFCMFLRVCSNKYPVQRVLQMKLLYITSPEVEHLLHTSWLTWMRSKAVCKLWKEPSNMYY